MHHLEPQRNRRPRVRSGQHALSIQNLSIKCNLADTRVWFNRSAVRCVTCWHPLEDPLATKLRKSLADMLRADIGNRGGHVADDFDDSQDGLKLLAGELSTRHPYLRLQTTPSRATLFRIASFQHSIVLLDSGRYDSFREPMALYRALESKLEIELAALIEGALK